ncbi:hypothetical protein B0T14DRAFT_491985 [Immersiella caudata]|uniref:Uncharacterized protein n=1 Tax=Immersiella caudata TaxID=314043 RepID=A0AA39XH48_9PEZI|nr:hypothetical protein B0T14DRAFT_491985 [Immersiella caudata]
MRLSSILLSVLGGASLVAAVPVQDAPALASRQLEERAIAEIHERALNATIEGRQAPWALVGFTGAGCTGGLAFGYTGAAGMGCTNTNFARSVGLTPGGGYTPQPRSSSGCSGSAPGWHHAISAIYFCYSGDVRSFHAAYTGGSPI